MKNLIKFEFRKLFRQKSFYVIMTIITALPLLFAALIRYTESGIDSSDNGIGAWEFTSMGVMNSNFTMVFGIFVSLFVCEDFVHDILKNFFAKGYSRTKLYFAKYIVTLTAMLIIFTVMSVSSFITVTVMWDTGAAENYPELILSQLGVLLGYHAFFFALSVIIGRTGGAIAIGIVAPLVISLLLQLASLLTDQVFGVNINYSAYWLDGLLSTAQNPDLSLTKHLLTVLYAQGYTVGCFLLGLAVHRRKQV